MIIFKKKMPPDNEKKNSLRRIVNLRKEKKI